jgi:site-specific recombinase XerD
VLINGLSILRKKYSDRKIANWNIRLAYDRSIQPFLKWCEEPEIELSKIMTGGVGRYLREKQYLLPTKKQPLAVLRRFFKLLVERLIIVINPAAVAETERLQVVDYKTLEVSSNKQDI